MKFLFILFLTLPVFATNVNKDEEARKAAEVLGATYTPPDANDKTEVLIDFEAKEVMNDEEKDMVLANYERTRSEYKEDSSDTLFERISKAYVRNLDRILTRKKAE